ncbi:MAG: radical SAM protein [Planctomycetota bacterium]
MEKLRVLLVKSYQKSTVNNCMPSLGNLYLVSTCRQLLKDRVEVAEVNFALTCTSGEEALRYIEEFEPDVVGFSALNWEAQETYYLARRLRERGSRALLTLGGPYPHKNVGAITSTGVFDWIFDGEADWAFPIALERWFFGNRDLHDIVGLVYRSGESYERNTERHGVPMVGVVDNLDDIPFPAWDLIDFDQYSRRTTMMCVKKGKRISSLFTSRGCPFLCTYCHDIFGKKFRWRSPENVEAEVKLLVETYGVDEICIVDDIFNMNSARMREVCKAIEKYKVHLCFPNGLRFDILDEGDVDALVNAGTYAVSVAIETVTPRLQSLVKKRLKMDATKRAIDMFWERGVFMRGFFMVGFPSETVEEIQRTIDFAIQSKLALACFFTVVPQPGTPLFELAKEEGGAAGRPNASHEFSVAKNSWYEQVYGVNLKKLQDRAYIRFYLMSPFRWYMILRTYPIGQLLLYVWMFLRRFWGGMAVSHVETATPKMADDVEPEVNPITSASLIRGGGPKVSRVPDANVIQIGTSPTLKPVPAAVYEIQTA